MKLQPQAAEDPEAVPLQVLRPPGRLHLWQRSGAHFWQELMRACRVSEILQEIREISLEIGTDVGVVFLPLLEMVEAGSAEAAAIGHTSCFISRSKMGPAAPEQHQANTAAAGIWQMKKIKSKHSSSLVLSTLSGRGPAI